MCSSNNSTLCAVKAITVPLLVVSMGGHYFIHDGEQIFDRALSQDKEFMVIEGAVPRHDAMPAVRGTDRNVLRQRNKEPF